MSILTIILLFGVAYLIGSLPTAYLVAKSRGVNIFTVGSGNMGANNINRALGRKWGALTWIVDTLKGVVAILVVRALGDADATALATMIGAIGAVTGHSFSIFASIISGQIRGGKGAATAIGTWFMFIPLPIIILALLISLGIARITRYVSLAVLIATAFIGIVVIIRVALGYFEETIYLSYLIVTALVFFRHQANIRALLAGNERKLGESI